jgi:flagellar basal body-associated protein FliL
VRIRNQRGAISAGLILGIVNTLCVLLALFALIYTRVLYKRPVFTEKSERERLAAELDAAKKTKEATNVGTMQFDPFTVNIRAMPPEGAAEGTSTQAPEGKMHFARISMTLELRDIDKKSKVEEVKPVLMDKLLTLFGGKSFNEITTVQGRYLLRNDILELVNELVKEPLVMNVFFSEFLVQ